jgi:beta-galactosidase/beta-glucuronidase
MSLQQISWDALDACGRGYPRPQFRRDSWYSLNGEWEFAIDPFGNWATPSDVTWRDRIKVPFAPETAASGIANTGFYRRCWYRRRVELAPPPDGHRLFLRFGAVDDSATVWVNGIFVGEHRGGYTPFSFDITAIVRSGELEIIVKADDDPSDLAKARGKQDWQLEPHSIWYPRTTGIWQTVWLEIVPATSVRKITFTPNLARWEIGIGGWIDGVATEPCRLSVRLTSRETLLAADTYTVIAGEVHRRVALSDPGIDDSRNELLWSPDSPNLIDVQLELWGHRGELLDRVTGYTALRATAVQGDRFVLNNRPYVLRLVLDQGYWPDTGLTAPDDAWGSTGYESTRRSRIHDICTGRIASVWRSGRRCRARTGLRRCRSSD